MDFADVREKIAQSLHPIFRSVERIQMCLNRKAHGVSREWTLMSFDVEDWGCKSLD